MLSELQPGTFANLSRYPSYMLCWAGCPQVLIEISKELAKHSTTKRTSIPVHWDTPAKGKLPDPLSLLPSALSGERGLGTRLRSLDHGKVIKVIWLCCCALRQCRCRCSVWMRKVWWSIWGWKESQLYHPYARTRELPLSNSYSYTSMHTLEQLFLNIIVWWNCVHPCNKSCNYSQNSLMHLPTCISSLKAGNKAGMISNVVATSPSNRIQLLDIWLPSADKHIIWVPWFKRVDVSYKTI